MQIFSTTDVSDYYDQTEVHYRQFWKLEKSMGLHYGIWSKQTKSIEDAILNVNDELIALGKIKSTDVVLDAGCGIGGSSIYLAKKLHCKTVGITLSERQVASAQKYADKNKVSHLCEFYKCDYTHTHFDDASFDIVWAIESFGSAQKKEDFFKEMKRLLKPGGKILFADTFKSYPYQIATSPTMQTMLNGWAISDILTVEETFEKAANFGFEKETVKDVTAAIKKSVIRMYYASLVGMVGTKLYNLFKNASPFSKIHYTTGLAQKKAYDAKKWNYVLLALKKKG